MTHQLRLTSETCFIKSTNFVGGKEDKGEFNHGFWLVYGNTAWLKQCDAVLKPENMMSKVFR